MATAPECIARFEREAIFVASPERMGRALRERAQGSWPASPIGGGGASPHVTPTHLANFLIAQAGFVPSGAANALATLSDLPFRNYFEGPTVQVPEPQPVDVPKSHLIAKTLSETVALMITAAADAAWRDGLTFWSLTMSPDDPVLALVNSEHGDEPHYLASFSWVEFKWMVENRARARRTIEIPRPALVTCGELWADSKAKLAIEDENAAALAGATAPSKAPTAQARQAPNSADATARVRVPATTGGPPHARRRRHSPVSAAPGTA